MIRQTGGVALAAISTRSSPRSSASMSACAGGMMPSWEPSSSMTRTSLARMRSLMRTVLVSMRHLPTKPTPLAAHLLAAVVHLDAQALRPQLVGHALAVFPVALRHWDHDRLHAGEPERER